MSSRRLCLPLRKSKKYTSMKDKEVGNGVGSSFNMHRMFELCISKECIYLKDAYDLFDKMRNLIANKNICENFSELPNYHTLKDGVEINPRNMSHLT